MFWWIHVQCIKLHHKYLTPPLLPAFLSWTPPNIRTRSCNRNSLWLFEVEKEFNKGHFIVRESSWGTENLDLEAGRPGRMPTVVQQNRSGGPPVFPSRPRPWGHCHVGSGPCPKAPAAAASRAWMGPPLHSPEGLMPSQLTSPGGISGSAADAGLRLSSSSQRGWEEEPSMVDDRTCNMENLSWLERMGKGFEQPEEMASVHHDTWGPEHIMVPLDLLKLSSVPSNSGNWVPPHPPLQLLSHCSTCNIPLWDALSLLPVKTLLVQATPH